MNIKNIQWEIKRLESITEREISGQAGTIDEGMERIFQRERYHALVENRYQDLGRDRFKIRYEFSYCSDSDSDLRYDSVFVMADNLFQNSLIFGYQKEGNPAGKNPGHFVVDIRNIMAGFTEPYRPEECKAYSTEEMIRLLQRESDDSVSKPTADFLWRRVRFLVHAGYTGETRFQVRNNSVTLVEDRDWKSDPVLR
jgi:hypothetical protein